jgi:tetratricopeptide (TPR) repeat protein
VGREDQLRDITAYFSDSQVARLRPLILYALGGQGKSQIALEYCQSTKKIYRGVFWVNANSEPTAIQSYHQIAAALTESPLTSLNDDDATIRVVKGQLQSWSERWLLVLDNFDQPEIFNSVQQFIPMGKYRFRLFTATSLTCRLGGRGDILFTSRHRGLDRLGKIYEIPPMSSKEGVSLLLGLNLEYDVQQHHMDAASKVVDRLGGLPLALDQAAAYIKYKQIPPDRLDDFLVTYEAQRKKVLEHTPRHFWEYGTMQIHGETRKNQAISAFTTWEMSFEQLQANDERSRSDVSHFLTLSAFFDLTHIGESLFRHYWEAEDAPPLWMDQFREAGDPDSDDEASSDHEDDGGRQREIWSSERFWELVAKSHELSLLQSISNRNSRSDAWFSLHPLIRDWLQLREPVRQRREYVREGINMIVSCIRLCETDSTPPSEKAILVAHIDMCLLNDARFSKSESMLGHDIASCNAGDWISRFYRSHGRYNVSERLERIILETKTTSLGKQHPDTLMSMNNLASVLSYQGKYEQAKEMHQQVLRLRETVLGKEHPDTLMSISNLASVLNDQGKYEQAEEMHQQVLRLRERVLGKEHPNTLTSMNDLALVLNDQGKYKQVEEMHQQVLRLRETVLGKEHPNTLMSISNLASMLNNQGKYKQAEEMHQRVLRLRERVLGKEHPDTLMSMNDLALVLNDQGKYKQVEEMHQQVLRLRERVLGKEHPDTLISINNLASVLNDQGKYEQTEEMHQQVLRLRETVLGKEHPDTLISMNNLASVLSRQGKYKQAEEMHQQELRLSETVLGKEHPDTLISMNNLASVLSDQGKYEQAEEMHQQVLRLRETVLGKEHPNTLTSMNNLASVLSDQGKYEQAEEMHQQVLRLRETVLGKEHPLTLISINNLALVLSDQGKYEQAEEMHQQELRLSETVLGKEHPDTLISMSNLASVLSDQGKYEQAEEMHQQVLRLRETALGKEHPDTLTSMNDLALVLSDQGKYEQAG